MFTSCDDASASKPDPCADELEKAMREHTLVTISRSPPNADQVSGFVIAKGCQWVLIAQTRDGGYFDDPVVVRLRDVVEVADDSTFAERSARSQPEWPPSALKDLDLDKTRRLIESLSKVSALIGIEQERRHTTAMQWIGVVDEIKSGWLWLREVRPDATWHDLALGYKLSRITKVAVLDDYQRGLTAIAGQAPDGAPRRRDSGPFLVPLSASLPRARRSTRSMRTPSSAASS